MHSQSATVDYCQGVKGQWVVFGFLHSDFKLLPLQKISGVVTDYHSVNHIN